MDETIPFGKYRNHSFNDIYQKDRQYLFWLNSQPWFKIKFNDIHQFLLKFLDERKEKLVINPDTIIIYTDGACKNNGSKSKNVVAGVGVHFSENNKVTMNDISSRLSIQNPTNNKAELTAILFALQECLKQEIKDKIIILKGNTQSIESKAFKLQSKKIISFDDIQKIATSEGDVKLVLSGPVSIFSKRINAKFDKINNNLISASAQGNVKIETKSETITCNSAKYNNKTNLISLKGNVIIKRDKSILTGEKGYMNLNTRKSKIESSKSKRVKGIFSPIQK